MGRFSVSWRHRQDHLSWMFCGSERLCSFAVHPLCSCVVMDRKGKLQNSLNEETCLEDSEKGTG